MRALVAVGAVVVVAGLVLAGCSSGRKANPVAQDRTWKGATVLSERVDLPSGLALAGSDRVVFTTGGTTGGEHAVRVATLAPATPAASTVLAHDPAGEIPDGPMAVAGDSVYLAIGSGIVRQPLAGGPATVVVDGRPASVRSIEVDATHLWWTTSELNTPQGAEVARMPLAGGPVEVLAAGAKDGKVLGDDPARKAVVLPAATNFHDLVLDGGTAFVATPSGIVRIVPGSPPTFLVDDRALGGPVDALVLASGVLYATVAGNEDLLSVPKAGGTPTKLVHDVDDTAGIAVAGGEVLYFVITGSLGDSGHSLRAVPIGGGAPREVTAGPSATGDLVVTDQVVVFTADDQVWSAPLHA